MKHILQFVLLLAFTVCAQAQFQYRPTPFTAPFVSTINSQAAAQTYLGIGSSTNNALLNATNQVFTGTNTFEAAKFFPPNRVGMRLLWSSPTNFYFPAITSTATTATNAGGWALMDPVLRVTLPALLGSNSVVVVYASIPRTNANTTAATWLWFVGPNTNYLGAGLGATTTIGLSGATASAILLNANSYTNQFQGGMFTQAFYDTVNFADTSVPFDLYIGQATTTSHTNLQVKGFRIYEIYAP